MHHGQYAAEIVRERMREIHEQQRRSALLRGAEDRRPHPPAGPLRRSAARAAVAVSRGARALARRLDAGTPVDVGGRRSSIA